MFCKKCGNPIGDDLICTTCGFKNEIENNDHSNDNVIERNKVWAWLSGIMFFLATIPFYKGYDKMVNYYSSDSYFAKNKNAYVGGDAYNYIINAGYSTAFFVLAVGAALLGVGFLIVYYLSDKKVS